MSTDISTYLKYANLQMAAEALYGLKTEPTGSTFSGAITEASLDILTTGNERSSKFTPVQAQQFIDAGWTVVEHKSNTATGFSGTLFRNNQTGEQILSFRSTEFADDAARDNQATNVMEIKAEGWAFGQIADMENWFASLKTSGKVDPGVPVSVTGYSLGGHLATAFNLLHQNDLTSFGAPLIAGTYTFNGAGVGTVAEGHSLSEVMNDFTTHRTLGGNADLFTDSDVLARYNSLKDGFREGAVITLAQVDAALQQLDLLVLGEQGTGKVEALRLHNAMTRVRSVAYEAERITAGVPSGGSGDAALPVVTANIAASALDYQLAVLRAGKSTAGYRTDPVSGGVDAYAGRNPAPGGTFLNFHDLYGASPPSAVSNSQLHYGTATPIYIEDQPLFRGTVIADVGNASWKAGEVKLLVNNFGLNDFGDTHSLVLIVDSLSVQNMLARLDTGISESTLNAVFAAASSKKADATIASQGKAEGDVLENVVKSLADMLGVEIEPMAARLEGGTWVNADDRGALHRNLAAIADSPFFEAIKGRAVIRASSVDLQAAARNDFGALNALIHLSPFWIAGKDAASKAALEITWKSAQGSDFLAWQEDRSATIPTTFTDQWIQDRARLLSALMTQGRQDNSTGQVYETTVPTDRVYEFKYIGGDIPQAQTQPVMQTLFARSREGVTLPDQRIAFGDEGNNALEGTGNRLGDHLYGGIGNDTLDGLGGDDYLQGDAGDDVLEGGEGNDALAGGTGADIYRFDGDWGVDTVIDADGLGRIEVDGIRLTGGKQLNANEWRSDDEQWSYVLGDDGGLVISKEGSGGRIIVRNWAAGGGLGLELDNTPAQDPAAQGTPGVYTLRGDQIVDGESSWTLLPDGSITNSRAASGLDDLLWASQKGDVAKLFTGHNTVADFNAVHFEGLGGNDFLSGTRGDDHLDGGDGDDVIFGGLGSDRIMGGDGNDVVLSNIAAHILQEHRAVSPGWQGGEPWTSGNVLSGSIPYEFPERVALNYWAAPWRIERVEDGNTLILATFVLAPGLGEASPENPDDADVVDAGAGNDHVWGGVGADHIDGGSGNDVLVGMQGADAIIGGEGNDTISGDVNDSLGAVMATSDVSDGTTRTVSYGRYPFKLNDGAEHADDVIDAGDGDDIASGDGGNDLIWGGRGSDRLYGDDDRDGLAGRFHGKDCLDGGEGDDWLVGGGADDRLYGGLGDDVLLGDERVSVLEEAYHGNDRLEGGEGFDQLVGGGGSDTLLGGLGADYLWGDGTGLSGADDVLDGGEGFDLMWGGGGDDQLISDGGDYLAGGAGDDSYRITLRSSEGALSVAEIDDNEGLNTISIDGVFDASKEVCAFSQDGSVYLAVGRRGVVSLGSVPDISHFRLQDASGKLWSLQSIVDASSGADGKLQSGSWTAANGLVSTRDQAQAQTITGTSIDEHLDGGASADRLEGAAGDDVLWGSAGSDILVGGAGCDLLRGGAGTDTLYGGDETVDDTGDIFLFDRGDGVDYITGTTTPGANGPLDVIRFGAGVALSDVKVSNLFAGTDNPGVCMQINYGTGDRISLSPGGEGDIKELQFADGSSVLLSTLIEAIPAEGGPSPDGVLRGGDGEDLLIGTPGDDRMDAQGGDDVLVGGQGKDSLVGGAGRNIYRFALDSGSDTVEPTTGEQGVLEFAGSVAVRIEGQDLLLSTGGNSLVRVQGYTRDPAIADAWQIDMGDGAPLRNLGKYVQQGTASAGNSLMERKRAFLDEQAWQLRSSTKTYGRSGQWHGEGGYRVGDLADSVAQQSRQMQEAQALVIGPYQTETEYPTTATYTYLSPITEAYSVTVGQPAEYKFVPISLLYNQRIPRNSTRIYFEDGLQGYLVQTPGTGDISVLQTRVIGYRQVTYTSTSTQYDLAAVQSLISGTGGDDRIVFEYGRLQSSWASGELGATIGSVRGLIESGEGDDRISVSGVAFGVGNSDYIRLQDWGVMRLRPIEHEVFIDSAHPVNMIDRGFGAWIDMGAGNDEARGTDGADFIIGGAGSDWLDGMAGSDTYYVGANGQDTDRISDMAFFDGRFLEASFDMPWLESIARPQLVGSYAEDGDHSFSNKDVVEFDTTVSLGELDYRWSQPYDAPFGARYPGAAPSTLRMLELYQDGHKFLEIEYETNLPIYDYAVSLPGVELFKFADGRQLTLDELLTALDNQKTCRAPELVKPFVDANVQEDSALNLSLPADAFADPQGQILRLSATLEDGSALPEWLHFDVQSQQLNGTPGNGDVGQWAVRVVATNEAGLSTSNVFSLSVGNTNDAPIAAVPLANQILREDEIWRYEVPATAFVDVDAGDMLSYSATLGNGDALPLWLSFDATTRTFTGTPDNADVGSLNLQVVATDAAGAVASTGLALAVVNVNDAPTVAQPLAAVSATENAAWSYVLPVQTFADVDAGDALTWQVSLSNGATLPSWLNFDSATRTLSGTPGHVDLGALGLSVTATDSAGASASTELALTVAAAPPSGLVLIGTANRDVLRGGNADDYLDGREGNDILQAGGGNNVLLGGAGSDILQAGNGDDRLDGGDGDDILQAGNGNNALLGGAGRDILQSGIGDDHLEGGSGNDVLQASDGNDWLDGGEGNDLMQGGSGDDIYVVESTGDWVQDTSGADTVRASISYVLGSGVETLILTGASAIAGTGNSGGNSLYGNTASNVLDGKGGKDVLYGGAGGDTYVFGRGYGQDMVMEDDADSGNVDTAIFGADIASSQLWFRQAGDDLVVSIIGTTDSLTLDGWYLGGAHRVETFRTADGRGLLESQVQNLVQAMASFSPPAAGQTTMPASYQSSLNTVIAANWQ